MRLYHEIMINVHPYKLINHYGARPLVTINIISIVLCISMALVWYSKGVYKYKLDTIYPFALSNEAAIII